MKRIVLQHPSGLMQILGVVDEQPVALLPAEAGVRINGEPAALNLVAAKRSYFLYKPLMAPQREAQMLHEEPERPLYDPRQQ